MTYYLTYEPMNQKPYCEMCGLEMKLVKLSKKMTRAECTCGHAFAVIPMKWHELEAEVQLRKITKERQFNETRI